MKNLNIINKKGIKLNTANKYVDDDINVGLTQTDKNNLVAENIKKDVNILGVVGSYEGGGGGASLNVAYGTTPPTDTTKIWLKCEEPQAVDVQNYLGECAVSNVVNWDGIDNPTTSSYFCDGYFNTCYIGNNQIAIVGYNHIRIYDVSSKNYVADYSCSVNYSARREYTNVLFKDNVFYFAVNQYLYSFDLETQTVNELKKLGSGTYSYYFKYIFFSSDNTIDCLYYYSSGNGSMYHSRYGLISGEFISISIGSYAGYGQYFNQIKYGKAIKANNYIYNFYLTNYSNYNYYYWKYSLLGNTFTAFTSFYNFMTDLGWTQYYSSSLTYDGERYIYLIGGIGTYNGTSNTKSDLIIKYDTFNDIFELLDNKLIDTKYNHFSELVDNRIYIFGGEDDRRNLIDYFDLQYPLTENNVILTINNKTDNYLPLISTEKLKLNSNIASAYKGNADNLAEKVNAYYWDGSKWKGINCDDYMIYFSWDALPTLSCALHNNVAIDLSQYYHTNGKPTLSASVAGGGMTSNINGTVLDITNNSSSSAQTIVITATVNNTEYQTTLTVDVPATTTIDDLS